MAEPVDPKREMRRVDEIDVAPPAIDDLIRRARRRARRRHVMTPVGGALALAAIVGSTQFAMRTGGAPAKTAASGGGSPTAVAPAPVPSVRPLTKPSAPPSAASTTPDVNALYASASALAGAPRCKATSLRVSYVQAPEGMLMWSTNFTLTNTGSTACSFAGYPTLGFNVATGAAATAALTNSNTAPFSPVNGGALDSIPATAFGIGPGASAYFYIASTTRSDGPCDLTHRFTVTLRFPGDQGPGAMIRDFTPASCGSSPEGMVSPLTPVPPSS